MVETAVQLGAISPKESEEMQIEALKKAYEELKEMYAKRVSFRSDQRQRHNAPSV